MGTTSFLLVKWYMDCVTDGGEAAILYFADLHWRGVRAHIGSVLMTRSEGPPVTRTSLGRYELKCSAERISVAHPRLKIRGCWESDASPIGHTVYEEVGGSVRWDCVQPRSRVSVLVGNREFNGFGYAECLTLTVPPWQLPMRELRWGRFVAPDHALAWIDWQGPFSTTVAVLDSRQIGLQSVSDGQVVADDAILLIAPGISLRAGQLGSTILPGSSGLRRLFPRCLFNVNESKGLSQGRLTTSGRASTGWVIHEVVKWEL